MQKKSFIGIAVTGLFLLSFSGCKQTDRTLRLDQDTVRKVVAAMSVEEKAELVVGTGMHFEIPDSILPMIPEQIRKMFNRPVESDDSVYKAMVKRIGKLVPGAAGRTAAFDRLGIPATILADGPAGLRIQPQRPGDTATYFCTAFPVATLLASSWDTALVEEVGKAMGNEVLEYGADILLAPALNIQRNPLCGRNFEYYSEDPLVTGKMAAAMVRGIQSEGVGTSIKHFVANNQETNRMTVNAVISRRALREIYLRGFRIAVQEGHPWTVMSSYNMVNGTYTSESPDLLTSILRDDWGFKGYVMTDWGGGSNPVAQMKAGNDLLMPGTPLQIKTIVDAVKNGELDSALLDRNAERILNIVMKSPKFRKYPFSGHPGLKEHAAVARKAAAGGMILLKNNDKTLPFATQRMKIAAFGNNSYETITGGTGSGDVNEAYSISLADGLAKAGLKVDDGLQNIYMNYIKDARRKTGPSKNWLANIMGAKMPVPEMDVALKIAADAASVADIAVITIGRNAGEGADRELEDDFLLSAVEQKLIRNVSEAFHNKGKKVVVVLNINGVIETASWREQPDAILLSWLPGQEAGAAIADVLTGKINPSGKLATTFPLTYEDEPSATNFPGVELESPRNETGQNGEFFGRRVPAVVVYQEDIYVGYRYFRTFDKKTAYPFGYGLSYTSFGYGNLQTDGKTFGGNFDISVDVTNNGNVPGREVVQLYLHAPSGELAKPDEELRNFAKTRLLKPGETETVSFTLIPGDLASFDEKRSAWVAEAGTYEVRVGASSEDIRETASFELENEIVVLRVSDALAPESDFKRLHK